MLRQVANLLLRDANVLQGWGEPWPQHFVLRDLPRVRLQLWRLLLQQMHLRFVWIDLPPDVLLRPAALLLLSPLL